MLRICTGIRSGLFWTHWSRSDTSFAGAVTVGGVVTFHGGALRWWLGSVTKVGRFEAAQGRVKELFQKVMEQFQKHWNYWDYSWTVWNKHGTVPKKHGIVLKSHGTVPKWHGTVPKKHRTVRNNHGIVPKKHGTIPCFFSFFYTIRNNKFRTVLFPKKVVLFLKK